VPARAIGFVADRLVHLLGARPRPEQPVTEGEIRAIVDIQAETGGLEEEEKAMIHHIFEFGEKTAQEVMVPRTSMVAIARTGTVREAGELTTERRVSRLPVYGEDLDDIVGVVYAKDLLPLLAAGQDEAAIGSVMRPVLRVPETKRLSDLMTDFRRHRRTFAIVLDEYGGTAGLVTLEDLLEEVVGDIYDEYDIVRAPIEQLASGAVALDGRMGIDEASAALGVELPEGDYSSVAGLLYDRLGMVPRTGQVLDLDGIRLVVDELDGHRISRVLALRIPERSAGAEGDGPSQATT
jgi:CBS domain containing-hemolysin-like protein